MGYHLRLTKGLSYCGAVKASKSRPDVWTEDKAAADAALASGYFKLMGGEAAPAKTGHLDKAQLESMKVEELKHLAEEMGIETAGLKKNQLVEAIAQEEVEPGEEIDPAEEENEPDYGESSPTMTELQEQK